MDGNAFAASLREIAAELDGLADLPRDTATRAAPKLAEHVQDEFNTGADPNGRTWAQLKSGGSHPLDRTGRMRSRLTVVADGLLVKGKLPAPGNIHQYGAKGGKIPQRMIFPLPSDMPSTWERSLEEAAAETFEALTPKMQSAGK